MADEIGKLLKNEDSSSQIKPVASQKKLRESKKRLNGICRSLLIDTEAYEPKRTANSIDAYIASTEKVDRILYSVISKTNVTIKTKTEESCMSYLKRENAILSKLKETDYAMFDGDADEAVEFLSSRFASFINYANIVIEQQYRTPLICARYEGEDLCYKIETMDAKRRIRHESAIASVNILNRLSGNLGLEPFADIDTKDRHKVADMVGDYIGELYRTGTKGFDGATYQKTNEYDASVIEKRQKQALAMMERIFGENAEDELEREPF